MKISISKIIIKYLKLSNYKINFRVFELQLESHPEYPSIKSISDTFDYFKIDNLTAKVPQEAYEQLPDFFISLVKNENNFDLSLIEKSKDHVIVTNNDLKKQKLSLEKFKENWEGTILAIEYNEVKKRNFGKYGINIFYAFFCILFLINLLLSDSISFVYNVTSLFGFLLSYFIAKESLGIHSESVEKVCKTISKSNGCNDVINSKHSKLFNVISLSDASIIYFAISILSFLLIGFNQSISSFISFCSIPIVFYAVYYQAVIIKKWCALCLGISIVLLIQFMTLLFNFEKFIFDSVYFLKYISIVFSVLFICSLIKKMWIRNLKLSLLEIDFYKFKRDQDVFYTLLNKQKLINNKLIGDEYKITFGSKNPLIKIDAVTNPFCGYCSESFKVYYNLIESYKDLQINFIFSIPNDITTPQMQIAVSILNIYFKEGSEKALQAMKDWYFEREIETWKIKYNLPETIENDIFLILKNQNNWLLINDITQTPITLIDDFYFPKQYNIEDLEMFIGDMLLYKNEVINNQNHNEVLV